MKPNTKHKPKFSASICNQTQISTHIFLYFVRNQTQNSKNNEQNPIFSETYLYSISGKVGSVVWVHIFWISSDIGQWQHESTAWVSGVWWWVSSNMDLIVGQSERGIERVLRITWESFFFFFGLCLDHTRERDFINANEKDFYFYFYEIFWNILWHIPRICHSFCLCLNLFGFVFKFFLSYSNVHNHRYRPLLNLLLLLFF